MPSTGNKPVSRTPKLNSRQLQAEEARNRIINAALGCFANRGFDGASIQLIAKAADASVPLIIYHFSNKKNLWQETIEWAVKKFEDKLIELQREESQSATEKLKAVIAALVHSSAEFPEFHRLMAMENHEDTERLDWLCERFVRPHNKTMNDIIVRAQQEGSICNIPPERLSHAIVGMATIFSQAAEFKKINRKNLFSAIEIQKTIDSIEQLVFISR